MSRSDGFNGHLAVEHVEPDRGRVSDQAYERLRDAILRRELPVGTVLAETDVARQLGVSRTPVRQALRMLLQEGLVSVGARRQITVRGVSPERRHETFLVREALERAAVEEAARMMAIDDVDQLRLLLLRAKRAADVGNVEEFIDLDEEFHQGVAAGARLPLVVKFLEQLRAFVRLMGIEAVLAHEHRMHDVITEHTAILDAVERRDVRAALAAMGEHLTASRAAMEAGLEKQPASTGG